MSAAPRSQLTNGQSSVATLSSAKHSDSGKFLPSIARRTGFSRDSPSLIPQQCLPDNGKVIQNRQHALPQYSMRLSPDNDRQQQVDGINHNMRQKAALELADGGVAAALKTRRWIFPKSSEDVKSPSPDYQEIQGYHQADISSPLLQRTWHSNPSRNHIRSEEIITRKLDRKAIARRHLVCGLVGGNHAVDKAATPAGGGGREDARRAHSFNCHTGELSQPLASNLKQNISTHSRNLQRVRRSSATERARAALDNWNSLVHQLHAEQHQDYLRQGSAHLAVLSDADAETSGGSHREALEDDERFAPTRSHKKICRTTSLTFTDMKFPVGIGFTRYRPLTPNLLARLDKQKLPVKRRTQLWVNTIQETKRTLSKMSVLDAPIEGEAGEVGSCAIRRNSADKTDMMAVKKSKDSQLQ